MKKAKCVILIALAMLMSSSSHAHAGLVTERETMRGIEGIYVTTEALSSGNEKYGLSKEKVQKDVVLKLQMAGVKVIALKDLLAVSGLPWLHVRIVYVNSHPDVACHITVELLQEVSLKRNLDVTCFAKTWSGTYMRMVEESKLESEIRDVIKNMMDKFVKDYLAVNPRKVSISPGVELVTRQKK